MEMKKVKQTGRAATLEVIIYKRNTVAFCDGARCCCFPRDEIVCDF
jgi:hypothetical protein